MIPFAVIAAALPETPPAASAWKNIAAKRALTWEPNQGQGAATAQFLARADRYSGRLEDRQLVLSLPAGLTSVLRLEGAREGSAWRAEDPEPGFTNYFYGKDRSRWVTHVPQYGEVRLASAYPGIDWVMSRDGRRIAYRFEVAPQADPGFIRLTFPGQQLSLDNDGSLLAGPLRHAQLHAFQLIDGERRDVPVSFALVDGGPVMFRLGQYDSRYPLTIDPVINFHLFQGGAGSESAIGAAIGPQGFIHYAGWTDSMNLFLAGSPFQDVNYGRRDVFVTKLYPNGQFFFSTYIGGSQDDMPEGMAVDSFGNVFVAGSTSSPNFPISQNGFQPTYGGNGDGFLVKMTAQGTSLLQSTFLGGSGADYGKGIASDAAGNATVVGYTASIDFPTRNAWQPGPGGGVEDVFLFKLRGNGSDVVYSTYFGAEMADQAFAVALDTAGNAIVTGRSNCSSGFFPDARLGSTGNWDIIVFKWRVNGNGQEFLTCIGGTGIDTGSAIALDAANNIYVAGSTASLNFPVVQPFQSSYAGATGGGIGDAVIMKLPPTGNGLIWSTYFGGSRDDFVQSIAVEPGGAFWITGTTFSSNFPNTGVTGVEGSRNQFVTRLNPVASQVLNAYFFRSLPEDLRFSVAIENASSILLAGGVTDTTALPAAPAPLNNYRGGMSDAWVGKLAVSRLQLIQDTHPAVVHAITEITFTQRISNRGPEDAERVVLQGSLPQGLNLIRCSAPSGGACGAGGSGYRAEIATLPVGRVAEVQITVRIGLVNDGVALPVDASVVADSFDDTLSENTIRTTFFTAAPGTVCNYSSTPVTSQFPATGGATTFLVNAPVFCPWTVSTPVSWLTIATPVTATGNGSATFIAAPWNGTIARAGSVTIDGQRFVLIQRAATDTPFFTDVPTTHQFFDTIQIMRASGITSGCDATRYCPDDITLRGQMAVFIIRALLGTDTFPFPATPYFTDVPATHPQFRFIQKMRELGVTAGCTATTYCPDDAVNRGQMAAFMIRARLGLAGAQTFSFPDNVGFQDVPPSHPFYGFVQKMRELGITTGCTTSTYCPSDFTTRAQMSAFLVRAFLAP